MYQLKQLSIVTLLLFILASGVSAQKWGVVTSDEREYTPPEKYLNDGTIVLFDKGYAKTEYRGLEFKRHVRFKVMDASHLDSNNTVLISYYEYDTFRDLKAQIIKIDGSIIKLKKNEFKTIRKSLLRECVFEFPNLSNGDIFEYSYCIDFYGGKDRLGAERYFLFNLDEHNLNYKNRGLGELESQRNLSNIPTWYFDHPVFCRSSVFTAQLGSDLDYSYTPVNVIKKYQKPVMERIKVLRATAYKKYTWTLENIRPFVPREFQGVDVDEVKRISLYFKLFTTQGQNKMYGGKFTDKHFLYMGRNFLGYLNQYLRKTKNMKKTVRKLRDKTKTDIENIKEIYSYITDNYFVDSSGFTLRPVNSNLNKMFKKKIGSPFELNLLLVEFLKIVGIDAYPVLINTENKVNFRYSGNFNHVITYVNLEDEDLFIDASFKGCEVGTLTSFSNAKEGIVVDIEGSYPIDIDVDVCDSGLLVIKK